jgi:tRNA pseudouridine38-40 synthase
LRLTIEYDGTDFAGFQLQAQGQRTVQGTLEDALLRLTGATHRVHGAGRTDAGVHASGQVVHFDTDWPTPIHKVALAMNPALPRDLVVKSAVEVDDTFHARFTATARVYRYAILNRAAPSALLGRFTLHIGPALDVAAMQAAARNLEGVHDFASFGAPDVAGKSTVRHIEHISVRPFKDCLLITVRGNAFLRSQVRAFVGTLLKVGRGRLTAEDVATIRDSRNRATCPKMAPARGLTLVRVEYDGTRRLGDVPRLDNLEHD